MLNIKYDLFTKDNHPSGDQLVGEEFTRLFQLSEELKQPNLSLEKKVEITNAIYKKIGLIAGSYRRFKGYEKISFEPAVLEKLCFFEYTDSQGERVKFPLFLTQYFPESKKYIDFSGVDWTNVCLSIYEPDFPEELKQYLENIGTEEIFNFGEGTLNIPPIDFAKLYYGPTRSINSCKFRGLNLSGCDTKPVANVFVFHCDFRDCKLTSKQGADLYNKMVTASTKEKNDAGLPRARDGIEPTAPKNEMIGGNFEDGIFFPFFLQFNYNNLERDFVWKTIQLVDEGWNIILREEDIPEDIDGIITEELQKEILDRTGGAKKPHASLERSHFTQRLNFFVQNMLYGLRGCYLNGVLIDRESLRDDDGNIDNKKIINFLKQAIPTLSDEFLEFIVMDYGMGYWRFKRLDGEHLMTEYQKLMDKITTSIPTQNMQEFIKSISFPKLVDYVQMKAEHREQLKSEIEAQLQQYTQSMGTAAFGTKGTK